MAFILMNASHKFFVLGERVAQRIGRFGHAELLMWMPAPGESGLKSRYHAFEVLLKFAGECS